MSNEIIKTSEINLDDYFSEINKAMEKCIKDAYYNLAAQVEQKQIFEGKYSKEVII